MLLVVFRLKNQKNNPQRMNLIDVLENPYRFKIYRRIIDTASFTIYSHWVKKGEQQNRAALFENEPKCDLNHDYLSQGSFETVNKTNI
jgi:phosphorylase kinase gamma subunit